MVERPPTLRHVADLAGVSVATASAVARGAVDGPIRISAATRERVLAAINELGYRPNRAARSLRTRRMGMIALVVPDITNPVFPLFVRAAELRAEHHGTIVTIWDSHRDATRERAAIDAILDRQLDGAVLVTEQLGDDDIAELVNAGVRVAATDQRLNVDSVDLVSEALEEGAAIATRHLIDRGHRRIAHVAGDPRSTVTAPRLAGYESALADAGLTVEPALVVGGGFDRADGAKAAYELLDLADPPSAVLAANDVLAIGVLQACVQRGVAVPDDLAVVGVDNSPEAEAVTPALTTMDVRPSDVAIRLVDLLLARLDGDVTTPPVRELVTPTLVRRDSS